jgi:elongation factor Ts
MSTPEINAKVVMQLRAMTGLPMMKCKEALEASGGDLEKAVEWARKKGLETAAKKADRTMKEGRVAIRTSPDGKSASMVQVDCETEPVATGPDFRGFVDAVLAVVDAHAKGKGGGEVPVSEVLALSLGKETVDTAIKGLVARIGENMAVRRAASLAGARVATYLHHNAKVGVLVEVAASDAALASKTFLDELGMHVAFAKPAGVSRDQVAKELIDKEMEIYREQAKQDPKLANKPPAVLDKILVGKLDKFYAERVLLEQPWVKDGDHSVKAVLEALSKKVGGPVTAKRFVLFQVGA